MPTVILKQSWTIKGVHYRKGKPVEVSDEVLALIDEVKGTEKEHYKIVETAPSVAPAASVAPATKATPAKAEPKTEAASVSS